MKDPLYIPYLALSFGEPLPLSWAVKYSASGIDPLHSAWLASRDGEMMQKFIRERLETKDLHTWQTIANQKLAKHILGAQPYFIRLYGLNKAGNYPSSDGPMIAADAVRKVFRLDDVITLKELMVMPPPP